MKDPIIVIFRQPVRPAMGAMITRNIPCMICKKPSDVIDESNNTTLCMNCYSDMVRKKRKSKEQLHKESMSKFYELMSMVEASNFGQSLKLEN
jgi:hypothetical protein